MPKGAVSVTLERENLLWLRGQARASGRNNVSQVLDRLVTEARTAGRVERSAIRSVVGTVRVPADDPDLSRADEVVRALFPDRRTRSPSRARRPRPRGTRG